MYNKQPGIFTSYKIEKDLFNGKVHYTSEVGEKAIAFESKRREWNIQSAEERQEFGLRSFDS